ncbi:acyl-CoA dehydrogenase family protein [Paeniglutamicibacter kerguelensis]|uniref:Alkylation response protein AidB-like acyl-CoA dehydrogenase n=1 Tax=Paeniglutamicibacter kerguelensis TaxID=254788 RepID=A0ABS4XC20_9MICC|nr:acyl-CoA dehydrogenase family protein [Paeniglutamicibacter kerguelensis]MBP2385778.1 alkylation response protein AidB-like acyl-CoA dehydrogenase [Paeniglutamicibacter kerguelensis]
MKRTLFEEDHEHFRELATEFNVRELSPHYAKWDAAHQMPRSMWSAAGEAGLLGLAIPEEFGGMGIDDYRFRTVMDEEFVAAGHLGVALAFHLHDDLVLPYLLNYGSDELKTKWLPGMADGSIVTSCALTEPGCGSDLRGVRTKAVRDGDDWLVTGQKTFIGNGVTGDASVVLARTDGGTGRGNADSYSLFMVGKAEGYTPGNQLDKMGVKASDTAELFFDEVRVPGADLIGELGAGLRYVKEQLPQARLAIAVAASAVARASYNQALQYATDRHAFGDSLLQFQNTRFVLADLLTEVEVTEGYVDRAVLAFNDGELDEIEAAQVKLWASERAKSVSDRALQIHGGYGYILEYPIAQSFLAARLLTIFGGTSEIMRESIGRSLGTGS